MKVCFDCESEKIVIERPVTFYFKDEDDYEQELELDIAQCKACFIKDGYSTESEDDEEETEEEETEEEQVEEEPKASVINKKKGWF